MEGMSQFYPAKFDLNMALAVFYSHHFVSLSVICVSCACIFLKGRYSHHRHHHGAASLRERKLTTILLTIALLSLMSWLPFPIVYIIISLRDPLNSFYYFHMTALILYLANSLVNPIVHSLRMSEFKACVVRMFCTAPNHNNTADLPLNNR